MTERDIEAKAAAFRKEFIQLVHKHCPNGFEGTPAALLVAMNRHLSVFDTSVWTTHPRGQK